MTAKLRLPLLSLVMLSLAGCAGSQSSGVADTSGVEADVPPLDRSELPEDAGERVQSAVALMREGNPQAALPIWQELKEKYPHHLVVVFELALTYRMMGRPMDTAQVLQPYESQLDAQARASLASAYDEGGERERAFQTLDRAFKLYPASGILYSTQGTCLANSGESQRALESYTKGIEAEPTWPSNYYQRSVRLENSNVSALSLIDGEIFRNLEPSTARSEKVAVMMLEILKQRVTRQVDEKGEESVSIRLVSSEMTGGNPSHPLQVFELALALPMATSVLPEEMTLPQLVEARNQFVTIWSEQTKEASDAPPLAQYLAAMQSAGHATAYHYWLFAPVDPGTAEEWIGKNRTQFEAFISYVQEHSIHDYL